jgi:hypothetical protein
MLSTSLRQDPECLTHKLRTDFKRWCCDGDVVNETARHSKAPNVKISGARSASDALLGWAIPMPRFLLQQQW